MTATLASLLKKHRVKVGWSQNKLARMSGVDPAYVNRIENGGQTTPSRMVVEGFAIALDLDAYEMDRLLYAAGLSPQTDWMTLALDYWARLSSIDRAFTGVMLPPEQKSVDRLEQSA